MNCITENDFINIMTYDNLEKMKDECLSVYKDIDNPRGNVE